jgi:signal transduction histidine kinase
VTELQRRACKEIEMNINQLLLFMNNLLVEAQLSARKVEIDAQPYSLAEIINETVTMMQPLAERKHLSLSTAVSDDFPATISGVPHYIKQILTNLLDNAIKFTSKGDIRVRAARHGADSITIEVQDSGIGMSADVIPHIFDAFWQEDGSITKQARRGVGLGLSIARQLTELMGGEISVTSQPGNGSTFTLLLPTTIKIYEEYYDGTISHSHH